MKNKKMIILILILIALVVGAVIYLSHGVNRNIKTYYFPDVQNEKTMVKGELNQELVVKIGEVGYVKNLHIEPLENIAPSLKKENNQDRNIGMRVRVHMDEKSAIHDFIVDEKGAAFEFEGHVITLKSRIPGQGTFTVTEISG